MNTFLSSIKWVFLSRPLVAAVAVISLVHMPIAAAQTAELEVITSAGGTIFATNLTESVQSVVSAVGLTGPIGTASNVLLSPSVSAGSTGYANYGAVGLSASSFADSASSYSSALVARSQGDATAQSRYLDGIQIDAVGLSGQRGTILVPINIVGGMTVGLTGPMPRSADQVARAYFDFSVGTATVSGQALGGSSLTIDQAVGSSGYFAESRLEHFSFGTRTIEFQTNTVSINSFVARIPVVFGQPMLMGGGGRTITQATSGVDGIPTTDPTYNLLRTSEGQANIQAFWGGVDRVLDDAGNTILGWSLRSDSTTNYSYAVSPVPEPSAIVLLCFGLLLMAAGRYNISAFAPKTKA